MAKLILQPVTVQGSAAAFDMAKAIVALNLTGECDVIILARGGGSLEDLSAFDDERLARAIYASSIPIITGIGHEIDYTIADFVADLRAPTPSAAAELAVPDQKDLLLFLAGKEDRLRQLIEGRVESAKDALRYWHARSYQILQAQIDREEQDRAFLGERLQNRMAALVYAFRARVEKSAARLQVQNPLARFSGGFVYAETDGQPVESILQLNAGEQMQIWTRDGKANVRVESVERR